MAKAVVPSLDAVPESLRGEYERQADGTYAIKLEGAPPGFAPAATVAELNTKLAEFRENNRALNSTKADLEARIALVKDIDPVKVKALEDELAALKKKQPESVAELAAIKTQLDTLGKQLTDSNRAREDAAAALARKDLEQILTTAAIKAGVQEQALPDFLSRGLLVWGMENGQPVAKRGGAPLFSTRNGTQPLGVEEWVGGMVTEASHLFKPSQGGNAAPGPGGTGNGATRAIPAGARLTKEDLADIASGKAVRDSTTAF